MERGRLTAATEVHHVTPIETAPTPEGKARLAFDEHNLRSLCHQCHRQAHRELKSGTKAEAKARAEARREAFRRKFLQE